MDWHLVLSTAALAVSLLAVVISYRRRISNTYVTNRQSLDTTPLNDTEIAKKLSDWLYNNTASIIPEDKLTEVMSVGDSRLVKHQLHLRQATFSDGYTYTEVVAAILRINQIRSHG